MYEIFKKVTDTILSLILLIFISPLFLIISFAIRIESVGPAIFSQKRVGKNKKEFTMYKFRTMYIDSPDNIASRKFKNIDDYITPIGRVLRKTSLDELPQLLNILRGEMSFIGPRPVVPTEKDLIALRETLNVYDVYPGVTGWAQVNGRDLVPPSEKATLDGLYANSVSLLLDVEILIRTVIVVLRRQNHVEGDQVISYESFLRNEPINKKSILILCKHFYPEYITSARLPYETAISLVEDGFKVNVISGYPKEYHTDGKVPSIEIHKNIAIRRLKYIQLKRSSFLGRLINYFSYTFAVLLNINRLKQYDSIIVYSTPPVLPIVAAWASKLFGVKLVFVSYDVYPEIALETHSIGENGVIHKVMNYINNFSFREIDKVVALSDDMKDKLLSIRPNLKDAQVEVIPNWYTDRSTKTEDNAFENDLFSELNPRENLIISYFGNMGIAQDLNTLLEAIKYLQDKENIKFLFAGHGNKVEKIKKYKKDNKLNNIFIFDYLHGQDFEDALSISDILVVTLKKELSGLAVPSRVYSFMMSGKPIISIMGKDTYISKELINKDIGYCIEPNDIEGLIQIIEVLKNNQIERVKKGKNARKLFKEKYNKNISTAKYVNLMHELFDIPQSSSMPSEAENVVIEELKEN